MIYAVSSMLQKKEVEAHCFGDCQKIALEGIEIGDYGPFGACYHADCEHQEAVTPVIGTVHGEDVCVRKLKEAVKWTNT